MTETTLDIETGPPRIAVSQFKESSCPGPVGTIGYRARGREGSMTYSFDDRYVRRLAEGDPHIESHFAGYFGKLLLLKIRRKFLGSDEVEDIRQETLTRVLEAIRRRSGLRDPAALGAYVHSVCENVMREFGRKIRRMPQAHDHAPEQADPDSSADSKLVSAELVELVETVLVDLPGQDQEILRELFLEERDRDEICISHGIKRDYFRVLLHRAKERFRKRYHDIRVREARACRHAYAVNKERPMAGD